MTAVTASPPPIRFYVPMEAYRDGELPAHI